MDIFLPVWLLDINKYCFIYDVLSAGLTHLSFSICYIYNDWTKYSDANETAAYF